jgi:lipoprotein NlpD
MNFRALNLSLAGLLVLLIAGCASNSPAPLVNRAPVTQVEKPAVVEVKPGYYMVKKGDTLYGIALDHGQDHKEIAAWNQLDNPNLIKIGQILRVAPPGETPPAADNGVAVTSAVVPPTQIESRPVEQHPVTAATAAVAPIAAADGLKREPKGGVQPYSDEAWAKIQNPAPVAAAVPVAVPAAPEKPADPVKPAAVASATDIDWAWPSRNKVTENFSDGSNKGLDFDGNAGEPVMAAAAGKVTLVTNSLRGYGNLIVVKHNTTFLSVYAHNSKMLVSEGQSVTKGQKIAEIGNTDADHPKLHFEIRREGKPVDPGKYLPSR